MSEQTHTWMTPPHNGSELCEGWYLVKAQSGGNSVYYVDSNGHAHTNAGAEFKGHIWPGFLVAISKDPIRFPPVIEERYS